MMKLTEKQRKFVLYYEGNATQAATKAGYSPKSAHAQGCALLKHPNIKEALSKKRGKEESKHWGRAELMGFWTTMAKEAEGDNNRLKASELLAKAEAMFVQKHEIQHNFQDKSEDEIIQAVIADLEARGYKVVPPKVVK